jgi:hypothetical protein
MQSSRLPNALKSRAWPSDALDETNGQGDRVQVTRRLTTAEGWVPPGTYLTMIATRYQALFP